MGGGKFRHKYELNLENSELRDTKNWTIIKTPTKPHKTELCEKSYFSFIQKNFREEQSEKSFLTKVPEVENTVRGNK